jgi:glutaredoxin-like protein NrdH
MGECNVLLYALSTCIHCRNAKEFLNESGVEYKCVEVDKLEGDERKKILEEIKGPNPRGAFPMLIIGDKVIVGFRQDEIREALNLK